MLERRFKVSTYQLDKVMDMTRLLLTLLVSFVPLANADYASCILENMEGVDSGGPLVAAVYFPKANLFFRSLSNVSPQLLLPMATTKTSSPCPKATPTLILLSERARPF